MDVVSVRVFRSNLTDFAERAKAGHPVIVRNRGTPVAMLRKATAGERLEPIGLREMRFSLGRCFHAVDRGRSWLVTFHGTPQLVLTRVPAEVLPSASLSDAEDVPS